MPRLSLLRLLMGPGQDAILATERRGDHNGADHGGADHGERMLTCQLYENNIDGGPAGMGHYDNENNRDCDDFAEMPVEGRDGGEPVPGCHDYENMGHGGMKRRANNYEALTGQMDPANIYCNVNNDTD